MHRILLVEDEELISTMVKLNLERNGFSVEAYREAEAALARLAEDRFDLVLLDIMLPGMQGDEALRRIRAAGRTTPVLMLTARSEIDTKIDALTAGADDYLTKPFDMQELLARVQAVIRRSQGSRSLPSSRVLSIGPWQVNLETRSAASREGEVALSEREAALLRHFAANPGTTLSRADILEEVWGMEVSPTQRTIDNFIVRFRKLFEDDPDRPRHFVTVRSIGYRFEP